MSLRYIAAANPAHSDSNCSCSTTSSIPAGFGRPAESRKALCSDASECTRPITLSFKDGILLKYYFLVPGYDFPISSVTLGCIITDLTQPHDAYFTVEEGDIDPTKIMPTDKYDFSTTVTDKSVKKAGLFARFSNFVTFGAEGNAQFDKATNKVYTFKHMHTEWFLPTNTLLDKAVKSERVANYLRDTDFQEPVYMVTSVKTVMGTSVATSNSKGRGIVIMLGVDASAVGVPLSIGPKYVDNVEHTQAAMFKDSSAIVFAFRLKEIMPDRLLVMKKTSQRLQNNILPRITNH
jgi:hypothetical protein